MRGSSAPWGVGSVFFPPQLQTSNVGPLFFNQLGNPQYLLSSSIRLERPETPSSPSKQTKNFVQGSATPFIPRVLLQDLLESDPSSHHGSQLHSNLLQGLKETGGKWYSVRTSLNSKGTDDSKRTAWPLSPYFQHSVRQLSAVWAPLSDDGDEELAIVAARTTYHVYFSTVSREENRVQFISTAVSKFQVPVAHVSWNPHVNGEAAVILESGVVSLFDVQVSGNGDLNNMVDLTAKVTLKIPVQSLSAPSSSLLTADRHTDEQVHGRKEPNITNDLQIKATDATEELQELKRRWWHCEYGWLPQMLLVANSQDVFLVDLIGVQNCNNATSELSEHDNVDTETSTSGIEILATVGTCISSQFCSLKAEKDNILAFVRDSTSEIYEFSVATERYLILFDARQPQIPILQWEHGMIQEPPSLLMMCPLSALRSIDDHDGELREIQNGRAILAASFKSGDMRVFCFGSKLSRVEMPLGRNSKKPKVDVHAWGNTMYAWDTSSRLYPPLADADDWRDAVRSSQGLYSPSGRGLFVPKSYKTLQNIAGIVLLFDNSLETWNEKKKTFTILQLTGRGELLAQSYEASHELREQSKASISNPDDMSDAEQSIEVEGSKDHYLKYETLPAFLKYLRTGSVLVPSFKNFGKAHQSITSDPGEGALGPRQEGISGGAISGKGTTEESSLPSPHLDRKTHAASLEPHLKAFMHDLDVPLSMYEVAQKVLCMGLPERLAPLAAGVVSDLTAQGHSGCKFPPVPPISGVAAATSRSGDPGEKDDSVGHTLLPNSLTTVKVSVPVPLLLEIHNIEKPNREPSLSLGGWSQTDPRESSLIVHGEHFRNFEHGIRCEDLGCDDLPFEDGHKILVEGSKCVQGLVKELVSKNDFLVISLSEPMHDCLGNSNVDAEADSQILFYSLPEKRDVSSNPGQGNPEVMQSTNWMDRNNNIKDVKSVQDGAMDDPKKRSFGHDIHKKFVVGKVDSKDQERQATKQYLKIDPNLCPVKLSFMSPGEELEEGEVTALENLQADFLQWQESFQPYRSSY